MTPSVQTLFDFIRSQRTNEALELLRNHPSLAGQKDPRGFSPLVMAAYVDASDVVRAIIAAGAAPDEADGTGNTALMGACFKGHVASITALIDGGADVNIQNSLGMSPLMFAIQFKQPAVCALLLSKGASTIQTDNNGLTAIDYAKQANIEEINNLLNLT